MPSDHDTCSAWEHVCTHIKQTDSQTERQIVIKHNTGLSVVGHTFNTSMLGGRGMQFCELEATLVSIMSFRADQENYLPTTHQMVLISKTDKEPQILNIIKANHSLKIQVNEPTKHSSQKKIYIGALKIWNGEMQLKTALRFHSAQVSMANIKTTNVSWQKCGKREPYILLVVR